MSRFSRILTVLLVLGLVLGACSLVPPPPPRVPPKVLFIGNSLTYWNEGVDQHLRGLAASASPPVNIETASVAVPNAKLKQHWDQDVALEEIRTGKWDIVVLQEGATDDATFSEYARRFDEEIRQAGARTVLFMPWGRQDSPQLYVAIEDIAQAHATVAAELGVTVAPVGLAWQRANGERPDLNLYDVDKDHPSFSGTYLAVCVIYATILGHNPSGLAYRPADVYPDSDTVAPALKQRIQEFRDRAELSDADAAFLQRIAWETVQGYRAQRAITQ